MAKEETIYLIVPAEEGSGEAEGTGPKNIKDPTVQNEGLREIYRSLVGGRREIEANPEKLVKQIQTYIDIVQKVAKEDGPKSDQFQLSEISLSLTLSASGNIGIASTSAEAGVNLVFKRS